MTELDVFHAPEWLGLAALAPLAWLLLRAAGRRRERRLDTLLGGRTARLTDGRVRSVRMRPAVTAVALVLAALAAAQPSWGAAERHAERRGVDILVCLDVSRSMLARDADPSRLHAARREIVALSERAAGDRLGLVTFAGEARLSVPLTADVRSFAALVSGTDTLSVQRGGTDLGAALETALEALAGATGDHEVVLLLTDGEDLGARGLRVAERLAGRNVTVHCVGFGSTRGSKVAIEVDGTQSYLRDRSGKDVVTAMDPVSLQRIAAATDGEFVIAEDGTETLVTLYESKIVPMARKALDEEERRERPNRFQWPLAGLAILWILELCLFDRTRR